MAPDDPRWYQWVGWLAVAFGAIVFALINCKSLLVPHAQ